jgi:hypothetical protein
MELVPDLADRPAGYANPHVVSEATRQAGGLMIMSLLSGDAMEAEMALSLSDTCYVHVTPKDDGGHAFGS